MDSDRYPENLKQFMPEVPPQWQRFAELREDLLLDYCYNTARAYWGDLEHVFDWCLEHEKDIFALSEKDIRQYLTLLRRRKYSESTLRRRVTVLRAFYRLLLREGMPPGAGNPAEGIVVAKPCASHTTQDKSCGESAPPHG